MRVLKVSEAGPFTEVERSTRDWIRSGSIRCVCREWKRNDEHKQKYN